MIITIIIIIIVTGIKSNLNNNDAEYKHDDEVCSNHIMTK